MLSKCSGLFIDKRIQSRSRECKDVTKASRSRALSGRSQQVAEIHSMRCSYVSKSALKSRMKAAVCEYVDTGIDIPDRVRTTSQRIALMRPSWPEDATSLMTFHGWTAHPTDVSASDASRAAARDGVLSVSMLNNRGNDGYPAIYISLS